jgi:putative SOS response-associated peptidase YedK
LPSPACGSGEPVETCTIVTTEANELAAQYHDRMPVILHPADYARWLDPAAAPDRLAPLLAPYPAELMDVAKANPLVNSPRNQGPELLVPAS